MKIAVAGKGGAGKTSIAGTLARLLARDGLHVLAIDADSGPNLALTLGLTPEQAAVLPTVDLMLIVVEAYPASLHTARRMAALAADLALPRIALVGNRIRAATDRDMLGALADELGLDLFALVPFDDVFARAERIPAAPLDVDPRAPAMAAIAELCARICGPIAVR